MACDVSPVAMFLKKKGVLGKFCIFENFFWKKYASLEKHSFLKNMCLKKLIFLKSEKVFIISEEVTMINTMIRTKEYFQNGNDRAKFSRRRSLLGPNFFDPRLTWLTNLLSSASFNCIGVLSL